MDNSKYLIVGLGNPGREYEKTRHNIGFLTAQLLAKKTEPFASSSFSYDRKLNAETLRTKVGETDLIIIKPQTFMNQSGDSVAKAMKYFDLKPRQVIVISDDSNLELGQVRARLGGDSGGHNGLKSIIERISTDFWRIRIGIGTNDKISLENYVLQNPTADEQKIIMSTIDKAGDYLLESISNNNLENHTIN